MLQAQKGTFPPPAMDARRGLKRVSMNIAGEEEEVQFGTVPLAKRVNRWIERTEAGMQIDILSSLLSFLTVITYMVQTHYHVGDSVFENLRRLDVACSAIFLIEWVFWLWLAHDRLRYIFSAQSLLDFLTTIPVLLSYFISDQVPGIEAFESMVRILRVLRVFRIFRLGKRLRNEVQTRLLTIIFTLVAIIFTSASLFYEIETRWGDRYPDLTYEQAIYWSVVTTTTIGYGDMSPSVMASQATLILVLLLTFTILPYQTSALVTALSETSVFMTAHYSNAARGRHIVVTGHLTAAKMLVFIEELYSTQDFGFPDFNMVFLGPLPPTDGMKRLLKTHKQANRLLYLQGSYMDNKDLRRAQVEFADAIFLLCNKFPDDAQQQDLQTSMAVLAVGQYCLAVAKEAASKGPKPLSEQLMHLHLWVKGKLFPKKQRKGVPFMCVQLLLPESQQNLTALLQSYYTAPHLVHRRIPPVADAAASGSPRGKDADAAGSAGGATTASSDTFTDAVARILLKGTAAGNITFARRSSLVRSERRAPVLKRSAASPVTSSVDRNSSLFWHHFAQNLLVICVSEVKYSVLGHSCVCPGVITLVSNLVHSVDDVAVHEAQVAHAPLFAQEYLEGSTNELYEVTTFPDHMVGQHIETVALYLHDVYNAVLIAAAGSATADNADVSKGSSQDETGGASVATSDLRPSVQLAPLQSLITHKTSAYVIASDLRVVLDIMEDDANVYRAWKAVQHEAAATEMLKQETELQERRLTVPEYENYENYEQQLQEQEHQNPLFIAGRNTLEDIAGGLPCVVKQPAELGQLGVPTSPDGIQCQLHADQQQQQEAANATVHSTINTPAHHSRRHTSSTPGYTEGSLSAASRAAALMSSSAKSLLTNVPGFNMLPGYVTGAHDAATGAKRRHRGAIQINTRAQGLVKNFSDVALAAVQTHLPDLRRRLSGASRKGRALACKQLQMLYHTRTEPEGGLLEAMVQPEATVQGHLLVCSCGTPPSALFCLLAPLRSSSLPVVQPVVILDSSSPSGPEWESIARLDQVYFVQGSVQDPEALLRANAEAAASAVVLLPWCSQADSQQPNSAAEQLDSHVLAAARTLKGLNPHMQVICELNQHQSLAFLDPLGSLIDWRCDEQAAAAATPAFMSGGVLLPHMVDSMTCQALYNHGTPTIISKLLTQWHTTPGSSSGGAVLLQLPVPIHQCSTFGQLFAWLVARGMVCCGLYCQAAQELGREVHYVYTNPHRDTPLHASDHAIVLVPARYCTPKSVSVAASMKAAHAKETTAAAAATEVAMAMTGPAAETAPGEHAPHNGAEAMEAVAFQGAHAPGSTAAKSRWDAATAKVPQTTDTS